MASSSSWRALGGKCGALMAAAKVASTSTKNVKVSATRSATGKSSSASSPRAARGIARIVPVSSQLGQFLGVQEASRTVAMKKVWEYIKLQNLQDPANKKVIRCDEKLKAIFDGKDTVGFLEIPRLMSQHFVKN
ncbi:hypothetical protein Ancab_033152 [Ancistrocladus abbreviatus]